jgi:hypothetical protein
MRVSAFGFLVFLIVLNALPALFVIVRIVRRARAAGVPAVWHVMFALFGGVIAGMVMEGLVVQYFLRHAKAMDPLPGRWQVLIVIAAGIGGSALAAAGVYLHLRMIIQRDPDYEEPRPQLDDLSTPRREG